MITFVLTIFQVTQNDDCYIKLLRENGELKDLCSRLETKCENLDILMRLFLPPETYNAYKLQENSK